jgi:hypothetical protein
MYALIAGIARRESYDSIDLAKQKLKIDCIHFLMFTAVKLRYKW